MERLEYYPLLACLVLGCFGGFFIARFGQRLSLLDRPNERSSHSRATPRGGGIGILAAFIFCIAWIGLPPYFGVPAVLVSLLSLVEDRFGLGVKTRLFGQFLCAIFFASFFLFLHHPYTPLFCRAALCIGCVVFIVGTANYYNFMDGINGIAAVTGVVGFGLLGFYAHSSLGKADPSLLCFGMALACAGFLPWNAPNARAFMGDVGSILLGFVFASVVIVLSQDIGSFMVMASFLLPFYADEIVTAVERLHDGESLTKAHRRHLYQVLANEAGLPHWKVSFGYALFQALTGFSVWKASGYGILWTVIVIALLFCLFCIVNRSVKDRFYKNTGAA